MVNGIEFLGISDSESMSNVTYIIKCKHNLNMYLYFSFITFSTMLVGL